MKYSQFQQAIYYFIHYYGANVHYKQDEVLKIVIKKADTLSICILIDQEVNISVDIIQQ